MVSQKHKSEKQLCNNFEKLAVKVLVQREVSKMYLNIRKTYQKLSETFKFFKTMIFGTTKATTVQNTDHCFEVDQLHHATFHPLKFHHMYVHMEFYIIYVICLLALIVNVYKP